MISHDTLKLIVGVLRRGELVLNAVDREGTAGEMRSVLALIERENGRDVAKNKARPKPPRWLYVLAAVIVAIFAGIAFAFYTGNLVWVWY